MFNKQRMQHDSFVEASFVAKIAKHSKSFGEGEFIKECLLNVANIICPDKRKDFEQISLSRRTVVRRIHMMADDIKTSLNERITRFEAFSIALDESTDASDTAQLAYFIRRVHLVWLLTRRENDNLAPEPEKVAHAWF